MAGPQSGGPSARPPEDAKVIGCPLIPASPGQPGLDCGSGRAGQGREHAKYASRSQPIEYRSFRSIDLYVESAHVLQVFPAPRRRLIPLKKS